MIRTGRLSTLVILVKLIFNTERTQHDSAANSKLLFILPPSASCSFSSFSFSITLYPLRMRIPVPYYQKNVNHVAKTRAFRYYGKPGSRS